MVTYLHVKKGSPLAGADKVWATIKGSFMVEAGQSISIFKNNKDGMFGNFLMVWSLKHLYLEEKKTSVGTKDSLKDMQKTMIAIEVYKNTTDSNTDVIRKHDKLLYKVCFIFQLLCTRSGHWGKPFMPCST